MKRVKTNSGTLTAGYHRKSSRHRSPPKIGSTSDCVLALCVKLSTQLTWNWHRTVSKVHWQSVQTTKWREMKC